MSTVNTIVEIIIAIFVIYYLIKNITHLVVIANQSEKHGLILTRIESKNKIHYNGCMKLQTNLVNKSKTSICKHP